MSIASATLKVYEADITTPSQTVCANSTNVVFQLFENSAQDVIWDLSPTGFTGSARIVSQQGGQVTIDLGSVNQIYTLSVKATAFTNCVLDTALLKVIKVKILPETQIGCVWGISNVFFQLSSHSSQDVEWQINTPLGTENGALFTENVFDFGITTNMYGSNVWVSLGEILTNYEIKAISDELSTCICTAQLSVLDLEITPTQRYTMIGGTNPVFFQLTGGNVDEVTWSIYPNLSNSNGAYFVGGATNGASVQIFPGERATNYLVYANIRNSPNCELASLLSVVEVEDVVLSKSPIAQGESFSLFAIPNPFSLFDTNFVPQWTFRQISQGEEPWVTLSSGEAIQTNIQETGIYEFRATYGISSRSITDAVVGVEGIQFEDKGSGIDYNLALTAIPAPSTASAFPEGTPLWSIQSLATNGSQAWEFLGSGSPLQIAVDQAGTFAIKAIVGQSEVTTNVAISMLSGISVEPPVVLVNSNVVLSIETEDPTNVLTLFNPEEVQWSFQEAAMAAENPDEEISWFPLGQGTPFTTNLSESGFYQFRAQYGPQTVLSSTTMVLQVEIKQIIPIEGGEQAILTPDDPLYVAVTTNENLMLRASITPTGTEHSVTWQVISDPPNTGDIAITPSGDHVRIEGEQESTTINDVTVEAMIESQQVTNTITQPITVLSPEFN